MKKIVYLLVFVSGGLLAQNDEAKVSTSYSKLLMGVSFSPDYAYRTLSDNGNTDFTDLFIQNRNNLEKAKIGYTGGLNLNYFFNKRIGIGTGVLFSNKGYQTKTGGFTFGNQINSSRGFDFINSNDPSLPQSAKLIYNHYYLEIPIKLIYKVGKGKIRFISSIGITTNVFLKSTVKAVLEYQNGEKEKSTTTDTENYEKINFSPTISVGLEKRFKNKSVIRLEPTFNYGILNIIDAPITAKLWSAGLNISYYLRLK